MGCHQPYYTFDKSLLQCGFFTYLLSRPRSRSSSFPIIWKVFFHIFFFFQMPFIPNSLLQCGILVQKKMYYYRISDCKVIGHLAATFSHYKAISFMRQLSGLILQALILKADSVHGTLNIFPITFHFLFLLRCISFA